MQQIKILQCSNSILWYNNHIGKEFKIVREEKTAFWVREPNEWAALNWVYKTDCEVLKETDATT